jgi:lipopolysaccharide/colanic/teichoic acid biosynthesis glycosyltransferase
MSAYPDFNEKNLHPLLRQYRFGNKVNALMSVYISLKTLLWRFNFNAYAGLKRGLDVSLAMLVLVALSPLLLLVALAIRLESSGPILFHQVRVGYRGQPFKFWKFRSMYPDAEQRLRQLEHANEMQGGVLFKMKKDPRITRVGRFIRKFSIDELPQLWNVLNGDMTLVGPRPALPHEVARYSVSDRERLDAKPGLTCIWQVSGRSDIPFEQQVKLDLRYIYFKSLKQDMKILLQTIPAVFTGRGAY